MIFFGPATLALGHFVFLRNVRRPQLVLFKPFSDSQSSNCFLQDFCVRQRLIDANGSGQR
jgi:hypothetical protein